VRGILDKHGSDVRMTSALGVGTVFWFDLPLEDSDADELELLAGRRRYELEANAVEG
jgi:two-component system sensor histidine kinase NblS